jgi:hypothetical protein
MRMPLGVFMLAMLFTLVAGGSSVAMGQNPRSQGFWFGVGAGYGMARARCHQCPDASSEGGLSASLRVGGRITKKALLGVDITGWMKSEGGLSRKLGNATISALFYPRRASGLFIKGGLGFSFYTQSNGQEIKGMGGGFNAGLGYDIPVGPKVSLTPVVDFSFGDVGEAQLDGIDTFTGWRQTLLHFGVGVTLH